MRNVLYPIYRGLRGDELLPLLEELERAQWLGPGEIEELQWRRLRGLIGSAATYVPYYNDLFADAGLKTEAIESVEDFRKLPLLTKDRIRAAGESILTKDPLRSGTPGRRTDPTGESLSFYNDIASLSLRGANTLRGYRWAGFDFGERQAYLWGVDRERSLKERARDGIKNYLNNILYLSAHDMSDEMMGRYAKALRRFRPRILVGYPSALDLFVSFCVRTGTEGPETKAVVTGGEMLSSRRREEIERFFSCPVFDRYGIRELGNVAHECEKHEGLHIFTDLYFVEVLDERGNEVEPGATGELVVTDLVNHYMPFIRYRTGDLAVRREEPCSCGRAMPLLERIESRQAKAGAISHGRTRPGVSRREERLVVKSKIHKAVITGEEPETIDSLRVDGKLLELSNIIPGEKVLIVDNTNGSRIETFALTAERGSGEIVSGGAVAKHIHRGDEVSIMAFAWSDGSKSGFKNILVDEQNSFVRYLTEVAGEML